MSKIVNIEVSYIQAAQLVGYSIRELLCQIFAVSPAASQGEYIWQGD